MFAPVAQIPAPSQRLRRKLLCSDFSALSKLEIIGNCRGRETP
jgi:hypothetical protein